MRLAGRTPTRREATLRQRRAAGPRGRSVAATLVIAIVCTTAAYVGLDSWKKWHAPVPASSDRAVAAPASVTAAVTPAQRSAQGKVTTAATASDTTRRVTKCVVNGVTSYSDADCPSNARASTLTVDTADNLAAGLPHDVRRQVLAASAQTAPLVPPSVAIAGAPDIRFLCTALDEKVKAIDAAARQALPAAEQDRLTAERKNARDQQFRLGC